MTHLVFSQIDGPDLPLEKLAAHSRQHFGGAIEASSPLAGPDGTGLELRVVGAPGVLQVTARRATESDWARARAAELRGRAGGMGSLAERCRTIWTVVPSSEVASWQTLLACALLASVALGPILPPDDATLLGVRSARERAERLRLGPS